MHDDMKRGLAKVLTPRGEFKGNAFLVGPRLVMTCAHVVADALGDDALKFAEEAPTGNVAVSFIFTKDRKTVSARVVKEGWYPFGDDPDGRTDIAVLRLDEPEPADAVRIPLSAPPKQGAEACLRPFLQEKRSTVPIHRITLLDPNEFQELMIEAHGDNNQFVEPGASGAPVFPRDGGPWAFGMVRFRDRTSRQAWLKDGGILKDVVEQLGTEVQTTPKRFELDLTPLNRAHAKRELVDFDIGTTQRFKGKFALPAIELDASLQRFPHDVPRPTRVEVRLHYDGNAIERLGHKVGAKVALHGQRSATVEGKGTWTKPNWSIIGDGCDLTDTSIFPDDPLALLEDPEDGKQVGADLRAYLCDFGETREEPAEGEDNLALIRQRIQERCDLKEIADDDDGIITLASVAYALRQTG